MYYRICECGAFLDPGEICEECRAKEKAAPGAGTSESGSDTNDTDKSVNDSGIVPQKVRPCND